MVRAKKSLGQHFLKTERFARVIALAANISEKDVVLEIGPGKGVLTRILLAKAKQVVAVEKDEILVSHLHEVFKKEMGEGRLRLVEGDILDFDPQKEALRAGSYKVVANIPYYITGLLLRHFLSHPNHPALMALLVQKEVAERITTKDGKESMLSVSIKAYGTPEYICTVPSRSFYPKPNVDSAIIRIGGITRNIFRDMSEKTFFEVVSKGFAHKRKQVAGNLLSLFDNIAAAHEALALCNIYPQMRAEDIRLAQWKCLAKYTPPPHTTTDVQ